MEESSPGLLDLIVGLAEGIIFSEIDERISPHGNSVSSPQVTSPEGESNIIILIWWCVPWYSEGSSDLFSSPPCGESVYVGEANWIVHVCLSSEFLG